MADEQQIEASVRLSVQSPNTPQYYGTGLTRLGWRGEYAHVLPPIWDPTRQNILSKIGMHPQNGLYQGALSGLSRDLAGAPWEITGDKKSGGKGRVDWYQDVLLNANKGRGWASFIQSWVRAYHNCDDGAVVEIIGRGAPDKPLDREAVTGIATLDPLRCFFTGNDEFPVFYQDAWTGKIHKLHKTRVHRFVDMPFDDPLLNGRGLCGLSRSIAFVQQAIENLSYIGESLSNEPPPGILIVNGVIQAQWEEAWDLYEAGRRQAGVSHYKPFVEILMKGDTPVKVEFVSFRRTPEGYDPMAMIELETKGIALSLNIDPQDVWPISGGSFGTNTQAKVLDKKSKTRAIGFLIAILSRFLNDRVLPDSLKYESKFKDSEQSRENAENAIAHTQVAKEVALLAGDKGNEIALRYLAKTVDSLADVLLDENGEMITLYDDDPTEDVPEPITVEDNASTVDGSDPTTQTQDSEEKDFAPIKTRFEREFAETLQSANQGDESRRRARTVALAVLARNGRDGMKQGLSDGGVEIDGALSGKELDAYNKWLTEKTAYMTDLIGRIYTQGLTDAQIEQSVRNWAGDSLQEIYLIGVQMAGKNPAYIWEMDRAAENCDDCVTLDGQIHRLDIWLEKGLWPKSGKTQCNKGCKCRFRRTRGRTRGNFLGGKVAHVH